MQKVCDLHLHNFRGVPEKIIDAIDKIRKKIFWFIPGHYAVYGKLQFEN